MIRVVIDQLVKHVGDLTLLDGFTLECAPGEFCALLAPSGSGKTLLARIIAGLEKPDEGAIYLDGQAAHRLPAGRRGVGFLMERDALWPHLSVVENLALPLKFQTPALARRARRERVAETLNLTGIDSLASARPDSLTALQRRRVALARAIVTRPGLLLLDDPSRGIPPERQGEWLDDLKRIHQEIETTTLLFTTRAGDALTIADMLAVAHLGRVVQHDVPRTVSQHPANAYVARLLGETNLIQGQVEEVERTGYVVARTPLGRFVGVLPVGAVPPATGSAVSLAFRPETIRSGESDPAAFNRFSAHVERIEARDGLIRTHLRGPGGWPLVAHGLPGFNEFPMGHLVEVVVPPHSVAVLVPSQTTTNTVPLTVSSPLPKGNPGPQPPVVTEAPPEPVVIPTADAPRSLPTSAWNNESQPSAFEIEPYDAISSLGGLSPSPSDGSPPTPRGSNRPNGTLSNPGEPS